MFGKCVGEAEIVKFQLDEYIFEKTKIIALMKIFGVQSGLETKVKLIASVSMVERFKGYVKEIVDC